MKAIWNNTILAEAPKQDLIYIEGNWYFPPDSVKREYITQSSTHTVCAWKGEASYYTINVNGAQNEDAAWYYSNPKPSAIDQVKNDFSQYVAFWRGVQVQE